jgi:hypothetical protein
VRGTRFFAAGNGLFGDHFELTAQNRIVIMKLDECKQMDDSIPQS